MRGLGRVELRLRNRPLLEQVARAFDFLRGIRLRGLGRFLRGLRHRDRRRGGVDLRVDLAAVERRDDRPLAHAIAEVDEHAIERATELRHDPDAGLRRKVA